jgi:hypothetical protein
MYLASLSSEFHSELIQDMTNGGIAMPRGVFRGATGNAFDNRTKAGKALNGGGLNAIGVAKGSKSPKK